jgi:hypothetical protein
VAEASGTPSLSASNVGSRSRALTLVPEESARFVPEVSVLPSRAELRRDRVLPWRPAIARLTLFATPA